MYDIVCMHVRYAAYACMMYAGNRQDVGIHTSFSKRAHHCKGNSVQRSKQKKRAERLANAACKRGAACKREMMPGRPG